MKSAGSCLVHMADPWSPSFSSAPEWRTSYYFLLETISFNFLLKAKNWCVILSKSALELSLARQTTAPENPAGHRVSQLSQRWGKIWSWDTKYRSSKCQAWSRFNSFDNIGSLLLFVLDLLHGFPLNQTFLGLAEEARDGVALCARWADSQLLRGAEDLVKSRQWHLPQQKSWLQAVLLPLLKGQDDWASSFCRGNRAGGEQIACFSLTFHFSHLSNDIPLFLKQDTALSEILLPNIYLKCHTHRE